MENKNNIIKLPDNSEFDLDKIGFTRQELVLLLKGLNWIPQFPNKESELLKDKLYVLIYNLQDLETDKIRKEYEKTIFKLKDYKMIKQETTWLESNQQGIDDFEKYYNRYNQELEIKKLEKHFTDKTEKIKNIQICKSIISNNYYLVLNLTEKEYNNYTKNNYKNNKINFIENETRFIYNLTKDFCVISVSKIQENTIIETTIDKVLSVLSFTKSKEKVIIKIKEFLIELDKQEIKYNKEEFLKQLI